MRGLHSARVGQSNSRRTLYHIGRRDSHKEQAESELNAYQFNVCARISRAGTCGAMKFHRARPSAHFGAMRQHLPTRRAARLTSVNAIETGGGKFAAMALAQRKITVPDFARLREEMVEHHIFARGVRSDACSTPCARCRARRSCPTHLHEFAYEDAPLPIAAEQTISQPYIVAFMVEALALEGGEKVLEIGTGSGYAAAVLAEIAGEVYTVERIGAACGEGGRDARRPRLPQCPRPARRRHARLARARAL